MNMAMPLVCEEITSLEIPDDQIRRRAVTSLRGYIYQVYQTLNAWLTLGQDEALLLETAEDFAVLARDTLALTQVKDTAASGSVTLRTQSVADTITSLWSFQTANPDKTVCVNYLTTSEIGTEKGLVFPDGQPGLTYWSVGAREDTDIEPLRQALLSLDLRAEIKGFLQTATPDELRDRILRRITWVCGAHDLAEVDQIIRDRLVYLGEHYAFPASDSERAKDSLVGAILRAIVRESDRVLSRAHLLRVFEKSATITMPATPVRQFFQVVARSQFPSSSDVVPSASVIVNAAEIPLPPRVIGRKELVSRLVSEMGRSGGLWLHGSSGLGKTVLAQLIVRQSKQTWLCVQLGDCPTAELSFRLCRMLQDLKTTTLGGIILDDLPAQHMHTVRLRLSMLANEAHRANGSLVVTSTKPPPPEIQDCFGQNGLTVTVVPYLSQEEVAELVALAGGDAEKWAGVIHVFCGPGHPQLVQARISGLQQRKWPDSELLAGIPGLAEPMKEVEGQRGFTRERLLSELSRNARELLYRLTLIVGYFDRQLAVAIGDVGPPIERPGEVLDTLLGPWVEALTSDRFRVSPLVGSAGSQTLTRSVQEEVHRRVVDELIARHPFPADFLGMLLGHALGSRHMPGLSWLTMAVMNAPDDQRQMMSEYLFLLPLLDTHQLLVKDNLGLSVMLRLAQFRIAAWSNRTDRLPEIGDRLIAEARMLGQKEIAAGFLFLAINYVLAERSLRINPHKWVPLLGEMEELLNGKGALIDYIRTLSAGWTASAGWTVPQFLFAIRASSPSNVAELVELFTELNGLVKERRRLLLSSLDAIQHGRQLMIDAAWLGQMREGAPDGSAAANTYRQLAAMAEGWGETDIAVRCERARAVMLNEYANNPEAALASLNEADEKYPNNPGLLRERAKVHYDRHDYPAALATLERILDAIPEDDHIERAFAFREAAISAARIGEAEKAGDYFGAAYDAASAAGGPGMPRMAVGLRADCALSRFQAGDTNSAVHLMSQAITHAEHLDPQTDAKVGFCALMLLQAILWMQSQVRKSGPPGCDFPIVAGSCSRPEPPDKIMDIPSPPLLASWYELAILDQMLGGAHGIVSELRKRTSVHTIVPCEVSLNRHLMTTYVISVDIEGFFAYLPEYVARAAHARESTVGPGEQNTYTLTDANLSSIKPADWRSDAQRHDAEDAILALAAAALCSGVEDFKGQLLDHVARNQKLATALQPFIASFAEGTCPENDPFGTPACHLGRLMKADTCLNPDDVFLTMYRLWEWLLRTRFRAQLEDMIADYFGRRWHTIIEEQRFQLNQPMIAVPAIEAALGAPGRGTQRITRLLLAAETAVRYKLDRELRSKLQSGH